MLWVDLTKGTWWTEETNDYKEFIGGRGVGSWLVFREVPPYADPLGPENIITFDSGPLSGTLAPCSGRLNISTKNVITGGISFSNAGGHFTPQMKYAGFDHIVVKGKAKRPVYLLVKNSSVEIRDAGHLWGKDVWETEEAIKKELNDQSVHVAAIGQAGENLAKIACVIVDRGRAAAWGGSGAVMGSKFLKAVVVSGNTPLQLADPPHFFEAVQRIWSKMDTAPQIKLWRKYGTFGTSGAGGITGDSPQSVRNISEEVWTPEKTQRIREVVFREKWETRRLACFSCPAYCSHFYHVKDGKYQGLMLEGIQSNTVRAFGSNLDVSDPEQILKANELANRFGIDTDEASATISWAMEVYEKNLIDENDTNGLPIRWGDGELVCKLLRMIALREGFGDLLAEGVFRSAQKIGRGTEKHVVHAKHRGLNEQNIRSHKGWALGIMTSVRGGGHLSGAPNTEQKKVPREVSQRLFGIPGAGEPTVYEGKGKLVCWFEHYKAVVDMVGLCTTTSMWRDVALMTLDDYSELVNFATGWETTGEDLFRAGERVYNIEKAFNTLHAGFLREDDFPVERFMNNPVSGGLYKGEKLDRESWSKMLDEYYDAHGWDKESSWQKKSGLEKLALEEVAKRLAQVNRLINE